jgi:hypothetical protein
MTDDEQPEAHETSAASEVKTLAQLIVNLKEQKTTLRSRKDVVEQALQTSFLQKRPMDVSVLKSAMVKPMVRTLIGIATKPDWHNNDELLHLIHKIIIEILKAPDVLGDAQGNMYFMSLPVFLLNIASIVIYYPLLLILMFLLLLGEIQGWTTIITGFFGASVSAFSFELDWLDSWSRILGIITGVFTAAKGITLGQDGKADYLYMRAEDLTVAVLRKTWGNIPDHAVFQKFTNHRLTCWKYEITPRRLSFLEFSATLQRKKSELAELHGVRVFCEVVLSACLIKNFSDGTFISEIRLRARAIEEALIDPHNFLTFDVLIQDDSKKISKKLGFTTDHFCSIKHIYGMVFLSQHSFHEFLKHLNAEEAVGENSLSDSLRRYRVLRQRVCKNAEFGWCWCGACHSAGGDDVEYTEDSC